MLPSGLQYRVLKIGNGRAHPLVGTQCTCTYRGTLVDGTQFDAGTANFAPNQVIKGWMQAMQLMREGDEWELVLPSELAYGDRGFPNSPIRGGEALVFVMQINKINGRTRPAAIAAAHDVNGSTTSSASTTTTGSSSDEPTSLVDSASQWVYHHGHTTIAMIALVALPLVVWGAIRLLHSTRARLDKYVSTR